MTAPFVWSALTLLWASLATASAARFAASARTSRLMLAATTARERRNDGIARHFSEAAQRGSQDVAVAIAEAARASVGAARGALLFERQAGALTCTIAAGERVTYFRGLRIALDDHASLAVRALRAGHRVRLDPTIRAPLAQTVDACAVPLAIDARTTAVLEVWSGRALLEHEVEHVVRIAELGERAWRIACDRERDRRRAEVDELTGLLTPAELRRRLALMMTRMQPYRAARCALLFIDTDRFKECNDLYGHAAGDALLRDVAAALRGAATLPDDLVARNGGDEFCVVFSDTDKAEAIARAERLRLLIGGIDVTRSMPISGAAGARVTASIGVAAYPIDASCASELLERADAAMYHSKRTGRNAVSFFDVGGLPCALRDAEYGTNPNGPVEG